MAQPRDQVTEAFELFDGDSDGFLLVSEAASAIRALGHILTDQDLGLILRKCGVQGQGRVNLATFRQMHSVIPPQDYKSQLQQAFRTVDKEGSGYIMATELRHLLTNMGDRLTPDDFNALLEEMDVDPNGRIQFKELIRLMSSR